MNTENYRKMTVNYNIVRRNLLPKEQAVFDKAFNLLTELITVSTERTFVLETAILISLLAIVATPTGLNELVRNFVRAAINHAETELKLTVH